MDAINNTAGTDVTASLVDGKLSLVATTEDEEVAF